MDYEIIKESLEALSRELNSRLKRFGDSKGQALKARIIRTNMALREISKTNRPDANRPRCRNRISSS